MNGDIGENLMTKYIGRGLLILDDIISTLFYVIRDKFKQNLNNELNIVLNSSEKWLKNLYLINIIFSIKVQKNEMKKLNIDFDFPGWLLDQQPLKILQKIDL